MANINCLGVITVVGSTTPEVTLLASEQTNSLQQSIVRVNVDSSDEPVKINLPSIDSYRGNWGILQIIISDATGSAALNNITIEGWTDGVTSDTIEGRSNYVISTTGESVRLCVAYDASIGARANWDLS